MQSGSETNSAAPFDNYPLFAKSELLPELPYLSQDFSESTAEPLLKIQSQQEINQKSVSPVLRPNVERR